MSGLVGFLRNRGPPGLAPLRRLRVASGPSVTGGAPSPSMWSMKFESRWPKAPALIALVLTLPIGCSEDDSSGSEESPSSGGGDGAGVGDGGTSAGSGGADNSGGSIASGGADPSTGGRTDSGGASTSAGGADPSGGNGGASPGSGGEAGAGLRDGCKRGVGYGYHSLADMEALSAGVSWWYNWDFRPDEAVRTGDYLDLDVEYAPMIWGAGTDRDAALADITSDMQVLLGFNEPNFGEQSNLSAADAAALWPEVEAIADAHDLYLVSPAVNFCGGNCQDTDPFNYLDEFLAACDGCRIDALGIHIYVGCNVGGENHAQWLINHIETYKQRFDLPLWLTEFACDSAENFEQQEAFLLDALQYLEAEPRIERYAWFAGRADNVPYVNLLGEDGQLTSLGQAYVAAPQPQECTR